MRMKLWISTAVVCAVVVQAPALAQNANDAMRSYDLLATGTYAEPPVAMWKDVLDKANESMKKIVDPSILKKRSPGQYVVGAVFGREFKVGDTSVAVSIYQGGGACDAGANSSSSTQTWGTDCPVRIQLKQGENVRVVEGKACAPYDWALGERDPYGGDRAYVTYNASKGALDFSVTSRRKVVKACNKSIKVGMLSGTGEPVVEAVGNVPSGGAAISGVTAAYSDTSGKTCKQQREHSELSEWTCSAPAGRKVVFGDTGGLFGIQFGRKGDTDLEPMFRPGGDAIGKKIEWRMKDGQPIASILRVFVNEDIGSTKQVLLVTKIDGDRACHLAYVDAQIADANVRAVEIADGKSVAFKCGSDKPEKVGSPAKIGDE